MTLNLNPLSCSEYVTSGTSRWVFHSVCCYNASFTGFVTQLLSYSWKFMGGFFPVSFKHICCSALEKTTAGSLSSFLVRTWNWKSSAVL